jgi:hypothetical protein
MQRPSYRAGEHSGWMVGKQEVEIASALPSLGRSAVGRLGELAYYRRHADFRILIGGTSGPQKHLLLALSMPLTANRKNSLHAHEIVQSDAIFPFAHHFYDARSVSGRLPALH